MSDSAERDGTLGAGLADGIDAEVGLVVLFEYRSAFGGELGELGARNSALIDRLLNTLSEAEEDVAHAQADLLVGDVVSSDIEHSSLAGIVRGGAASEEVRDVEGLTRHTAQGRLGGGGRIVEGNAL